MSDKLIVLILLFSLIRFPIFGQSLDIVNKSSSKILLATAGPVKIFSDEFTNSYEFAPQLVKSKANTRLNYLNNMINEKLLYLYGKEIKIDTSRQVKETFQAIFDDLMTEQMYRKEILPFVKVDSNRVDTVINQKILHLKIKWIFDKDAAKLRKLFKKQDNALFDSAYNEQFKNGVNKDERYMEITRYHLGQRNPQLAKIIDTLTIGKISEPIFKENGWYIFKIIKAWKDFILTKSKFNRIKNESITVVKKEEMDALSDRLVKKLMENNSPKILRIPLNITVAFIADFILSKKKYAEWKISELLKGALRKAKIKKRYELNSLHLVEFKRGHYSINDFLRWLYPRLEYFNFDKSSLNAFYGSVEQLVWRMTRDNFLTSLAKQKHYDRSPSVLEQAKWWKAKIIFSAVRNKLLHSITLNNKEITLDPSKSNKNITREISNKLNVKIYRLLKKLKRRYRITINKKALQSLKIEGEENSRGINLYVIKKNGLIPRTPYPIIDSEWKSWGEIN